MEIKCPKCESDNNSVTFKKRLSRIQKTTYSELLPDIKLFMNNDGLGETKEVLKEFLLCGCNRCDAMFFKETADSKDKGQ